MSVDLLLGAVVLLPLAAAGPTALLGPRGGSVTGAATALLTGALSLLLIFETVSRGVQETALGGYGAPLGIHLRADGLSAVFLGLTALVGVSLSVFAAASRDTPRGFWPLWLGCWSGLNAVFLSGDLFNTYVGLELVGLTAVALVALGGRGAWAAALRYLFIAVLGSLLFLVGVGLLVSVTGTLDISQTAAALQQPGGEQEPALLLAAGLMTVGLALKLALVPMHAWLISAHSQAPGAVSPLLSGLVIKAALFVILRVWLWVLPEAQAAEPLAWILGALGAAAVIGASLVALRQVRLKPLIAYSTVAQVGYWFLAFPLLIETMPGHDDVAPGAYSGIVALAVGHGIAKAGLFAAAGYLKDTYGTDEIVELHGAVRTHPMVVMSMGLSAVGLIGLPVSLGFAGKWQVATAAVEAQQWWILVVVAVGTVLTAGYLVRGIAPLLMQEDPHAGDDDLSSDDTTEGPTVKTSRNFTSVPGMAVLALGSATILTGFLPAWLADVLEVGAPW
ncbi:complex I subunit 5 family protein [Nesterenkonia populi]|uniref:complex I subunit 5 family protein n=1 Tax=Nesterenkonia populi TaxID=1591087 RepID=UPI0011BE7EA7|nr:proton-conducting transporter membrane subunit [Nesterenkonia populi]